MTILYHIAPHRWATTSNGRWVNGCAEGDLPTIFVFDNTADDRLSLHQGQVIAEDGTAIEGHVSWSEAECAADLGVPRGGPTLARTGTEGRPTGIGVFKHEQYAAKYPKGYVLEWVPRAHLATHAGLLAAYARNLAGREIARV